MKTIILFNANNQLRVELKVDLFDNAENFTIMDVVGRNDLEVVAGISFQQLPSSITAMVEFATSKNLKMSILDIDPSIATINKVTDVTDLAITTEGSMEGGTVDENYHQQVEVEGGNGPLTFSVEDGTLPAGLTLDPRSGYISGVPTTAATSTFAITVEDSFGQTNTVEDITIEILEA